MSHLGLASFSLNKSSAVTDSFAVVPDLATKPIPTNKWWQNAVAANPWPETLFNLPLATTINGEGLSISIPTTKVSSDTFTAVPSSDFTIASDKAASKSLVKGFDEMSVDISAVDGNSNEIYSARLVKGVPFVYAQFSTDMSVDTTKASDIKIEKASGNRTVVRLSFGDTKYAVYTPATTIIKKDNDRVRISASKNIVIASIPSNATDSLTKQFDISSEAIITGASVSHSSKNSIVTTTIRYNTDDSNETLVAVLPHQTPPQDDNKILGNIETVRGTAKLKVGNEITYESTIPENELLLSLPKESSFFSVAKLKQYIAADNQKLSVSGLSYDGGKELYRLANVAMIAHQSKSPQATSLTLKLKEELSNWLTYTSGEKDKYFYYDRKIKGLVAVEPQYGSAQFNDHHFHYGYFLYAASILGTYDQQFVKDYGKAVSAIGDDIAGEGSGLFPRYRNFDAYEGHSWAGGLSHFADGNNQESVSESVNAWFALMQWSKIVKDTKTEETAKWLYANESTAATDYYYENPAYPFPEGYAHSEVSLVWGGKSDWATFFSSAPEAKHAILMLPLSGGSQYLRSNNAIANSITSLDETLGAKPRSAYQDILLLGQSLAEPKKAQAGFDEKIAIDNSNSLSYIYYYLGWADK